MVLDVRMVLDLGCWNNVLSAEMVAFLPITHRLARQAHSCIIYIVDNATMC